MNQKKSSFKKFFAGKGFYIALFLCVAAVGTAGYFAIFHDIQETVPTPEASETASYSTQLTVPEITADYHVAQQQEEITTVLPREEPVDIPAESQPAQTEPMPGAAIDEDTLETGYLLPLEGSILKGYSADTLVYSNTLGDWRTHPAIDIAAGEGTAVTAVNSGTVSRVWLDDNMGYSVAVSHAGGLTSVYSSLTQQLCVQEGDHVTGGQLLGYVGTSALAEWGDGAHLHFAMGYEGVTIDPGDILTIE